MGFLAPWFLAGAVAAGLPIYIHLLRRHETTPQPFSSLMFFEKHTQSSIKHRRLRYLLLLSLRLALLLLLVLAFANPFIHRQAASMSSEKLQVIAVDDSFSMRAGTRLEDARREALSLLGGRRPLDYAQVMELGSQVHVLTAPTQDGALLRNAVESIRPGDSRSGFAELARAMRSMAENVHTPIELHLFSDMQKSAMPASFAEMALPANVTLVLHPEAKAALPNWTVESVNAPGQIWDPKKVQVQAVIAGYHTPAATRVVSLVVNGKTIATRNVGVPANGRASVEFQGLDAPYGLTRCEVRIDSADSLPADDASLFAVQRSDPQRVLFVHEAGDSRSPVYFKAALASAAEAAFTVDSVTPEQASGTQPSNYSFIVLSDVLSLPSSFENGLANYVRNGGGLLVTSGTNAVRHPHIPVFDQNILDSLYFTRDGARFLTVGMSDPTHPSFERADHWAGVKFYFAVRVDPKDSQVIARLTDGTPLLLEKKIGEGRVLLLTSGLDNLTNDFPLHPVFIPFVDQTARYLAGTGNRSGSRIVDSYLELRTAKEQAVSVEVVDPQGKRPLSLKEAASAQSFQVSDAGFYQVRLANGRQDLIGVNADRRESDLDVIPEETLTLWRGNPVVPEVPVAAANQTPEPPRRYGLWWYVMVMALIVAVAESLLSSQYLGTPREEP